MPKIVHNDRKVRILQKTYTDHQAARAVLDYFATRDSVQRETEIDSLANRIVSLERSEILEVMRILQKLELGRVYQGRRGRKTRFVWAVPMNQVGRAAQGQLTSIDELEDDSDIDSIAGDTAVARNRDLQIHPSLAAESRRTGEIASTVPLNITINVNVMSRAARAKLAELLMVLDADDYGSTPAAAHHKRTPRRDENR